MEGFIGCSESGLEPNNALIILQKDLLALVVEMADGQNTCVVSVEEFESSCVVFLLIPNYHFAHDAVRRI